MPFPPQHFVYRYIISALLIYNRLLCSDFAFRLLLGRFRGEWLCGETAKAVG